MNGLTVIVIAAVVLVIGYGAYGRWLARTWGIDEGALTPAMRMEDGRDYAPASRFSVFAHQFSSICGAGPVTGTIVAMMFGWLPVLLWVLVGGVFFGAVHDFGALYASIKNNGKSLGQLIEKYIGRTGRRLFLLFSFLFCCIVVAAFTAMVAGTFASTFDASGAVDVTKSYAAGCAGTISILFTFVAIYLVFACAMPIQVLKQPRDVLTAIMMVAMIVCAVLGIVVMGLDGQATMTAPMIASSEQLGALAAKGNYLFPLLFVSVACGALSGFHSLVSSGTSSKQLSNERDALPVGYGAMVLESFVGTLAVVVAAIMFGDMNTVGTGALNAGVASTPFQIFAAGVARGMQSFGVNGTFATVFMTMNVSALALTSLDAVARIGRTSFQEFFFKTNDVQAEKAIEKSAGQRLVTNTWFATIITLVIGVGMSLGGYLNIWPLFGASNQLLGGMTMITLAVFCRCTGRKGFMLYAPVAFLLCCTFTSLTMSAINCLNAVVANATPAVLATSGLQLVFAVLLMVLGLIVAYNCLKELFRAKAGSKPDEEPEWTELGRAHVTEVRAKTTTGDAEATAV